MGGEHGAPSRRYGHQFLSRPRAVNFAAESAHWWPNFEAANVAVNGCRNTGVAPVSLEAAYVAGNDIKASPETCRLFEAAYVAVNLSA